MKENKIKLKTYYIEPRCKCKGLMEYINNTKDVPCKGYEGAYNILYAHKCKKCGNIEFLDTIYPITVCENNGIREII